MRKNYKKTNYLTYVFTTLISVTGFSQTLNFTIDDAIDNGITITETITSGVDNFILTVNHSGNEQLDDLDDGDLVFFLSAIDPLTPYTLSVTKNGTPYNFTLNSVDYDTLEAGSISLENNSGAIISANQPYSAFGSLNIDNPANAANIESFTITPTDNDDLNDFGFHNINITVLGETLSVDNKALDLIVSVFPNPSNGTFTIKNTGASIQNIEILDLNGRLISDLKFSDSVSKHEIDLSNTLTSGIYLLKIQSLKATSIQKIVIE